MEDKLNRLFLECINELNRIGIDILNENQYGKIDISIERSIFMKFIYACDIHGDINKYECLYKLLKENNINALVIGRRLITKES